MSQNAKKAKRSWIIAAVSVICVLLVAAIVLRMNGKSSDEMVGDVPTAPSSIAPSVTPAELSNTPLVEAPSQSSTPEPPSSPEASIQPIQPSASAVPIDTAVSQGTEQTLQAAPVKPSVTPKETPKPKKETPVTNPTQKPEYAPEETVKTPKQEPAAGESKDGKVYVPGFGWQKESGGAGTVIDGEGDINKQVGEMD